MSRLLDLHDRWRASGVKVRQAEQNFETAALNYESAKLSLRSAKREHQNLLDQIRLTEKLEELS